MKAIGIKLIGTVWPNGEFGFSRVKETSKHPVQPPMEGDGYGMPWGHTIEETLDRIECRVDAPGSGLGLSNVANSHIAGDGGEVENGKHRGSKGLTRYGAKMVRNACHLIDESAPPLTLAFATFTLPSMDKTNRREVLKQWPEILRGFFQKLQRKLKSKGLPGEIAYVVELHPKRGSVTGEMWPHIHCVYQGKRSRFEKHWAFSPKQLGEEWRSSVTIRVPDSTNYWRKSHWNVQAVVKSCSSYMAKYLSKGCSKQIMADDALAQLFPIRSWWGAVGGIKERIKKRCRKLSTEDCLALIDDAKSTQRCALYHYYKDVEIDIDGRKFWIGACGKFTEDNHRIWEEYFSYKRALDSPFCEV